MDFTSRMMSWTAPSNGTGPIRFALVTNYYTTCGRGTVCLVLGDYIIHTFNNEIHMGRNVLYLGGREIDCLSHVVLGDQFFFYYNITQAIT